MSKNKINTKKEITYNHVVEKESGSRGTYFDGPDDQTKFGTGMGELIIRASGFTDLVNGKHWKKGHRPFGIRKDEFTNMSQLSDMKIYNADTRTEVEFSPELIKLNTEWFEKVHNPNLHALLNLRKNPTLKKARKTAEVLANEIAHFSDKPDELRAHVAKQNEATLEFVNDTMKDAVLDAMCSAFMEDRKSKLEIMKKK
jgi:hypothetical protein